MAKKKRSASSSKAHRAPASISPATTRLIRWMLFGVSFLFLFLATLNIGGGLETTVHTLFAQLLGGATFLLSILLLWLLLRRFYTEQLTPSLFTTVGALLFTLTLTGIIHSFGTGDLHQLAIQGGGGGMLGYFIYQGIGSTFGAAFGRLILFVLMLISLILLFEPLLAPLLQKPGEEDAPSNDLVPLEGGQVKVMGEIQANPPAAKFTMPRITRTEMPEMLGGSKKPLPVLIRTANWMYPPLDLLTKMDAKPQAGNIQRRAEIIKKTLADFGIDVTMGAAFVGPTVTQYTLKPSEGVRLNQITARRDDLALALAAQSLRVEAPIPGKGLVGVELPNEKKAGVGLRELLESDVFKHVGSKLTLALGRDAAGAPAVADLARMPHALIAGSTGSGKSVAINSIILTLLMNNSPEELRMILVDPKRVELTNYNGLPHLLTPVITEAKDTISALGWAVREMERRYKVFASLGKRNIDQYNQEPDLGEGKMPFIVIVIDELADLMIVAAKEVENSIVRLAQMARAVGIHLIVATQRPSVDVITGLIKANIPTRVAFAVASQIDSRTILDVAGAEKLLGQGDMLYVSTEVPQPRRVQGVFVPEREITNIIAQIRLQSPEDQYDPSVLERRVESRLGSSRESGEVDDELFDEAIQVVRQYGKASTTLLQTRLSVGYARAARLITNLEDQGIIGPARGSKPREVFGSIEEDAENEAGIAAYPERE